MEADDFEEVPLTCESGAIGRHKPEDEKAEGEMSSLCAEAFFNLEDEGKHDFGQTFLN